MDIALKVQDCMQKNEPTGFQLLEVNNPVNNKVYEIKNLLIRKKEKKEKPCCKHKEA